MRSIAILAIPALWTLACRGPSAEVSGEVAGQGLPEVNTVMFGGPFIILSDIAIDCIDLAWVTRHYSQGEAVTDYDFRLLQFAFSDPEVYAGVFNLAGEAAVTGKFLVQKEGAFAEYRGREGNLQVDELDQDAWALGLFDMGFDEGQMDGTFDAEWCRNLKDN